MLATSFRLRSLPWLAAALALGLALPLGSCSSGGDAPTCASAGELCNGLDDDCDGAVDEGFDRGAACAVGVGACQASGQKVCTTSGAATVCDATPGAPGAESCNGLDDDCDGTADEGLVDCCAPAATRPCGAGVGVCVAGTQTCSPARAWGECLDGAGQPVTLAGQVAEACNGADDDCDGETDEADAAGCTDRFRDQDLDGFGEAASAPACLCASTGAFTSTEATDCDDQAADVWPGAVEACNGVDDDCDGVVDDGVAAGASCSAGVGACLASGQLVCQGGAFTCDATPTAPGAETCNGLDDDCDGTVDEGLAPQACYTGPAGTAGVGACHPGTRTCSAGAFGACLDQVVPLIEVCNGADDDCDGQADESGAEGCTGRWIDQDADTFGGGEPICYCTSVPPHVATRGGDCSDTQASVNPGATEVCNGVDDDCDTAVDEGIAPSGTCSAGTGACLRSGQLTCQGGGFTCNAVPGLPGAEICNGLDDDCDGTVDEGLTQLCPLQRGVCAGSFTACVGGAFPACTAADYGPDYSPIEIVGDCVDNNCDGTTDPPPCL